ncbi:MAG: hypothetical protein K0S92_302 [Desertimonas sp.]|nr:hypothetical protein [Desertimonas sp.]
MYMKATSLVAVAALVVFASASTIHATDRQPAATECGDLGDTAPVNDGFPNRLSSLVGTDIRTGGHECFERVVLELGGSGELPGFQVQYEPDPILDSPRGEPVEVAGEATLVLSVGAWMPDIEGNGYQGPLEFVPTNVVNIEELQQIENFEGQNAWAIGLDMQRDFTVSTLTEPFRIVIDIALDPGGTPSPAPTPTTAPATGTTLPPTR